MITWPVILRLYNEDELMFVSEQSEWDTDPDLFLYPYDENDMVIDGEGKIFDLQYDHLRKYAEMRDTGKRMALDEFTDIIKRHVSAIGECCADKLNIASFRDGMLIVAHTNK